MDVKPCCTPGLVAYQAMMDKDRSARLDNQRRLRELRATYPDQVRLCCAHDPTEFEQISGCKLEEPATRLDHV